MPVRTRADSPRSPEASALLHASHAYSASLYAPEDNFVLSIDDLCAPDIRFFTAVLDGRVIGTAALALRAGYGEVKSMFVAPEARGHGAVDALLHRLVAESLALGLPLLRLETGPLNHAAMRVYARHGFVPCGRFGDYPDGPASVFMQRAVPVLRRMAPVEDMRPVHALLTGAFAYMDQVIDPPSSMNRMTPRDLAEEAGCAELWVVEGPLACMILTIKGETLYLGKLAVADDWRGSGLVRVMIEQAMARARALGLASVSLQTRVELTANQRVFQALGFVETGRTAHAGYVRPTSISFARAV